VATPSSPTPERLPGGGRENLALARVDALAAEVVARGAPLTFALARSGIEIEAVFRLRCQVVLDQGWATPEQFPDGLERDTFDERALQIVAWDGATLVGTTRLVVPRPGLLLPTEKAFELTLTSRDRVIDMSRTCRTRAWPDAGHRILWGLVGRAWIELRALGFTELCGIFSPAVVRLYRRLGLRVQILAPARLHWGEWRHPVRVRPAESIDDLERGRGQTIAWPAAHAVAGSDPGPGLDPGTGVQCDLSHQGGTGHTSRSTVSAGKTSWNFTNSAMGRYCIR
jgi:N-acyl-L-homoserine lactone synthetase